MTKSRTRVIDELKTGLEDSIAFSQGELSLVTTAMPTPPPKREPTQIADLRHSLCMSQAVFAAVINVSPKTVQSWEQGVRKPSQAALRMLEVIDEEPGVVKIIMTPKPKPTLRSRASLAEPPR